MHMCVRVMIEHAAFIRKLVVKVWGIGGVLIYRRGRGQKKLRNPCCSQIRGKLRLKAR